MIQKLSDLNEIFQAPVILNQSQEVEIDDNMWVLTCAEKALYTITLKDLAQFFEQLLMHYNGLAATKYPKIPAIFYLWLDPQTLQLRFNILSKTTEAKLPFGCKVKIVQYYLGILQSFLDTNKQFILEGDVIEEVDEFDDEEDQGNFVLDVYVKKLNE